ncbi:MAG: cytochrome b/b6 domain-containing protein [Chromatocurvus sp.]
MTEKAMVRVWDPIVRIFHWGLVAVVAVAWLTADEWDDLHAISGYVVAGLLAVRLIWGFVGGHYARFTQFLRRPSTVIDYVQDMTAGRERRYIGHNPAAAVMIVALMLTLAGTAWTGWLLENPLRLAQMPELPQVVAPAFADGDEYEDRGEEVVEELHEMLANGLLVLIALHVGGVILSSVRHRENLTRSMVTGDKRAPEDGDIA